MPLGYLLYESIDATSIVVQWYSGSWQFQRSYLLIGVHYALLSWVKYY